MLRRLMQALGGTGPVQSRIRLARLPRSPEEERIARLLSALPMNTRAALVEALAEDLRSAEHDPFRSSYEFGYWRLLYYQRNAEDLVDSTLDDLLVEERATGLA